MPYFFQQLPSTAPSFTMTVTTTSTASLTAFESTVRKWTGPHSRAVRLSETSGADYWVNFGSSTIVAASSNSMLVLGGAAEVFCLTPSMAYITAVATTTAVSVNVTCGIVSN